MRISDWSSDVCSSDLQSGNDLPGARFGAEQRHRHHPRDDADDPDHQRDQQEKEEYAPAIVVGQPPARADGVDRISDAAFNRRRHSHREARSEAHTSELQSVLPTSYPVFFLKTQTTFNLN